MIHYKIVLKVVGVLLVLLSLMMSIPLIYGVINGDSGARNLGISTVSSLITGTLLWTAFNNIEANLSKREGYLIVALGWIVIFLFGAIPYLSYQGIDSIPDAMFESMSGLTTTGATILTDIEALPDSLLLWRSMSQWIGGMGIIVLTVAIFPLLGIGGVELFIAESPGPTSDKIHPRIKETAKRLWLIYVSLTALLAVILAIMGMTLFDAVNHSMTTIATAGFSTKNASIAAFNNPGIEYMISFFMLLTGCNYTLIYFGLKGKMKKVWRSDEFKAYLLLVFMLTMILTISITCIGNQSIEASYRHALFHMLSLITTTGYVTGDYTAWSPAVTMIFFSMFFMGACAGSTRGGIKVIRHLVFFKNSILELKRILHPKALIRTKIDGHVVRPRILTHILVFLLFYMMIFLVGTICMSFVLVEDATPFVSAVGVVAASLGNVGPGIGSVGPIDNFAHIPNVGKWLSIILMLFGRLELFTILILLSPYFWRNH